MKISWPVASSASVCGDNSPETDARSSNTSDNRSSYVFSRPRFTSLIAGLFRYPCRSNWAKRGIFGKIRGPVCGSVKLVRSLLLESMDGVEIVCLLYMPIFLLTCSSNDIVDVNHVMFKVVTFLFTPTSSDILIRRKKKVLVPVNGGVISCFGMILGYPLPPHFNNTSILGLPRLQCAVVFSLGILSKSVVLSCGIQDHHHIPLRKWK